MPGDPHQFIAILPGLPVPFLKGLDHKFWISLRSVVQVIGNTVRHVTRPIGMDVLSKGSAVSTGKSFRPDQGNDGRVDSLTKRRTW